MRSPNARPLPGSWFCAAVDRILFHTSEGKPMSLVAHSRKKANRHNVSSAKVPLELVLLFTALVISMLFVLLVAGH